MTPEELKVGDRVLNLFNELRGTVMDAPERAIRAMVNDPGAVCVLWDGDVALSFPNKHFIRKLSLLELMAEAAQ